MRYILLFFLLVVQMFASSIQSSVMSVDEASSIATTKVKSVDAGVSGFIVHKIAEGHEIILKRVVVTSFDATTQIATLAMSDYDGLKNEALPSAKWNVVVGDKVILAFGYTRAILIAPNEEIYHQITKSVNVQWIHPDVFATILSYNSHPTPIKSDFDDMSEILSIGLIYFYIDGKLYTVDAKSFKILNVVEASYNATTQNVPFFTRVGEIETSWWEFGAGTNKMDDYTSYYQTLLEQYN